MREKHGCVVARADAFIGCCMCALTGDRACDLGESGRCSKHLDLPHPPPPPSSVPPVGRVPLAARGQGPDLGQPPLCTRRAPPVRPRSPACSRPAPHVVPTQVVPSLPVGKGPRCRTLHDTCLFKPRSAHRKQNSGCLCPQPHPCVCPSPRPTPRPRAGPTAARTGWVCPGSQRMVALPPGSPACLRAWDVWAGPHPQGLAPHPQGAGPVARGPRLAAAVQPP